MDTKIGSYSKVQRNIKIFIMIVISSLVSFFDFPLLEFVPFLSYDFSNVPLLLTGFAYGAPVGFFSVIMSGAIQSFIIDGDGLVGFIMHLGSSGVLVVVASYFYNKNKTMKNMIIGLIMGVTSQILVMLAMNYFVTPYYYAIYGNIQDAFDSMVDEVTKLYPVIVIYNILRGIIDSMVVLLIGKNVLSFLNRDTEKEE